MYAEQIESAHIYMGHKIERGETYQISKLKRRVTLGSTKSI